MQVSSKIPTSLWVGRKRRKRDNDILGVGNISKTGLGTLLSQVTSVTLGANINPNGKHVI